MKLLFQFFIMCFLLNAVNAQHIHIASNSADWVVSDTEDGANAWAPTNVGACLNEDIIDCLCNTSYPSPDIASHFGNCPGFEAIWGTPQPNDCQYLPDSFWFIRTFQLDLSECRAIESAIATLQADNSFEFNVNGQTIDAQSQWNQPFGYDISQALVDGENTIAIQVINTSGGTCLNYAFLAFCLDIFIHPVQLDANFLANDFDQGDGFSVVNVIATPNTPLPSGVLHEWFFGVDVLPFDGVYTPMMFVQGVPEYSFFSQYCRRYEIFHRVAYGDCETCYRKFRGTPCDEAPEKKGLDAEKFEVVDCSIIKRDKYPPVKFNDGSQWKVLGTGSQTTIGVYPNPAQSTLNISWDSKTALKTIRLIASDGKVVRSALPDAGILNHTFHVNDLPQGTYILQASDQNGILTNYKIEVTK